MIVIVDVKTTNIWTAMNGSQLEVVPITDGIAERLGSVLVDKEPDSYYSVIDSKFNRKQLDDIRRYKLIGQHSLFLSWAEDYIFKKKTALIDKSYTKSITNALSIPRFRIEERRYD
ncbi:hypothetical protein_gp173 [Bacillus phage vB_BceM_WH1]|nr:hypothetical protein_gp173 [Bacillus phage vB_BceM_WH1]